MSESETTINSEYRSNPVVRELMEASNDGFWDWNIQTGEVYFSKRWASMLGYKQEEIEPHVNSWEKLIHPDDLESVMEVLNSHLEGKNDYYQTEHRVRCKDGTWKWILDRGRVISRAKNGAPLRAAGAHTDINEKKLHEEELIKLNIKLNQSQKIYLDTFNLAAIGLAHIGLDYKWMKVNQAMCTITGFSETELQHMTCVEMIYSEDTEKLKQLREKLINGQINTYSTELRFINKEKKIIWINLTTSLKRNQQNNPEYFIYCVDNITEKKDAQMEREHYQATLQTIISSTTDLIYAKDTKGRYLVANPPVAGLLSSIDGEKKIEDIIGKNDAEIIGDAGKRFVATDRMIMEKRKIHYLEETVPTHFGVLTYDSVKNPIFDSSGEVIGLVGISRDITDKKKIEQRLHEAIKLRDEFLSIASHELKTPLTSLILLVQSMKRILNQHKDSDEIVSKIKKSIDQTEKQLLRLSHLIDEMLDVTRIDSGKMIINRRNFDLQDLVNEVSERLMPQIKAATGAPLKIIKLDSSNGLWDRYRIEQVITNLLTNAIRYGEGEPIELSLEDHPHEAIISVRDYGKGIPKEHQTKIFNRFERGENSQNGGGLGLGLFISKQIIDSHQGKILVESEPGKGSTFYIILPK